MLHPGRKEHLMAHADAQKPPSRVDPVLQQLAGTNGLQLAHTCREGPHPRNHESSRVGEIGETDAQYYLGAVDSQGSGN